MVLHKPHMQEEHIVPPIVSQNFMNSLIIFMGNSNNQVIPQEIYMS